MVGVVEFHIDQIAIDLELSEAEAARLSPVLKAAFEDLGKRVQSSPIARLGNPTRLALGELRIELLSKSDLLGPRGAARLADAFWERLTEVRSK